LSSPPWRPPANGHWARKSLPRGSRGGAVFRRGIAHSHGTIRSERCQAPRAWRPGA
jgi:hypothetical protein